MYSYNAGSSETFMTSESRRPCKGKGRTYCRKLVDDLVFEFSPVFRTFDVTIYDGDNIPVVTTGMRNGEFFYEEEYPALNAPF